MATFTHTDRPLQVTTPFEDDALFITGLRGTEGISRLFCFELDLVADEKTGIRFERILGQPLTVKLRLNDGGTRYFHGMVKRFTQGGYDVASDDITFIRFHAEIVPELWKWTKRVDFRIFQHVAVPDILSRVLGGLKVDLELNGKYPARNYCVQYGESDFDFISRLMEEEGIYYFFTHSDGQHKLVITDTNTPMTPGESTVLYDRADATGRGITEWEKSQEVRAGECAFRDHCFQLPNNRLEAKQSTLESVTVGEVVHKLRDAGNERGEIYEYPGGYGQRFDGISSGGQIRPQDLKQVFEERQRVARIRMEQEEATAISIRGASDCSQFVAGHRFKLAQHFDGNGYYLLTNVEHTVEQAGHRAGQQELFHYENKFTCIPQALRFRPQRVTRKPVISGVQTATVTGQAGEELFCDPYGRVKVQFHWDREGKMDRTSSCWVRVSQVWAGNGWGAFFWPRVGHEVVVAFEDGDPDRPLIVGSVYNAKNMPWFDLPVNKHLAGFKSASMGGTASKNFNGVVFNDKAGVEHLAVHSERNLSLNSEADKMIHSGRHKGERVGVANMLTVGKLIPGGGSGGGNFDEGNPLPEPNPSGVVGTNSVVTYGTNLQMACPLNHQLALGNNVQVCVNPFGLAAGIPGASVPEAMQLVLGSGMGGNMQFTIGTSAQFTLGQSFEISIGPPKIEIHQGYKDHLLVGLLCAIPGVAAVVFGIAYDVMAHSAADTYQSTHETNDTSQTGGDAVEAAESTAEQGAEQRGDKNRALLVLTYQLLMDTALTAVLAAECAADHLDWLGDDTLKTLYTTDESLMEVWKAPQVKSDPTITPNWWTEWGALSFGSLGATVAVAAEVAATAAE